MNFANRETNYTQRIVSLILSLLLLNISITKLFLSMFWDGKQIRVQKLNLLQFAIQTYWIFRILADEWRKQLSVSFLRLRPLTHPQPSNLKYCLDRYKRSNQAM